MQHVGQQMVFHLLDASIDNKIEYKKRVLF